MVLFKTESIHKHIIYTPLTDFEGCIVFFIFLKNRLHTINDTKIICAKLGISDCPKFHHNWPLLAVITRKKLFSQQKFLKKKAFFLKCFLFLKFCFESKIKSGNNELTFFFPLFWLYVSEFFSKIPQAVGESVEKRKSYQKLFLFCFQSRLGVFLSFCFKTEDCFFFNYIVDDLLFFKLQPTLFFFWGKWTVAKPSGMVLCCLYKTL